MAKPSVQQGEKSNDGTKYLFISFRLLGILMPEKNKLLYVIYSIVVNTLSTTVLPLTFALSYLIDVEEMSLNQLLSSLQIGINVYSCVAKFLIIVVMKRNLFKIKAITDKLDEQTTHPDELHEIREVIRFGHRMVLLFAIMYFSYSTSAVVGAVCSGRPPYSLYNPFVDWRTSTLNFVIVSLIEFIMINIMCFQEMANDTFAVIYIRIVHTQIKILIKRVSRIGSNPSATQEDNLRDLVHCIGNHRKIIELNDALAAVISITVFVQFMISGLTLGIALINFSAFGNKSSIMESVFFIVAMVWELLPMCYFVDSLVADARRLPDEIFHLNWMDQNKAFQQNCIFFMHRSQKPMVFYAGKVFPISLQSFVAIIKFSFSLCTLLSTMDLAARFDQE